MGMDARPSKAQDEVHDDDSHDPRRRLRRVELGEHTVEHLTGEVEVTLVDQHDAFVFGFSKLEVLFGHQNAEQVRIPYREIRTPGVEFRQERVLAIDPATRHVVTDAAVYDPDIVVIALGADYDIAATPGFADGGSSTTRSQAPSGCATNWRRSAAAG